MNNPRFPSQIVRDDETALVASAQDGNPAAFEELVSRYQSRILRLTYMITGNREDSEDGTQEAFLRACNKTCFHDGLKTATLQWN